VYVCIYRHTLTLIHAYIHRGLDIPSAEKDIVDAVRIAVNTPFMQVCVCVCVYIYIYTQIPTYPHIYMYIDIDMHIHILYTHGYIQTYIDIGIHLSPCVFIYICRHTNTLIQTCIHTNDKV
jgi:hypothetical protein